MPAVSFPVRRVTALTIAAVLLAGGIAATPAAAAEPATVTDITVAPYEAVNPLVPSASLPFLAATVSFDRALPDAGETFEIALPAGARAVLSAPATTVLADGTPLVAFTTRNEGGTLTGTFTAAAAQSLRVTGEFTFFVQVIDSAILSPTGGTYRPVFTADGAQFEGSVSYGRSIDLSDRVGGHWVRGAAGETPGRFVVQAKADGDATTIPHGGLWIGAGTESSAWPYSASAPDCAAAQVRAFTHDPGAMNYPVAGGTLLRAGTDYTLTCDDVFDGRSVVGATIPAPKDGTFYVLSSPRDLVGDPAYLPADNPAVPEAGRQVSLHMPLAIETDARRAPGTNAHTSTLMLYGGPGAGVGTAEEASPALTLAAISDPASGTDVRAGDRVTYTVTLTNSGNAATPDAAITADLGEVLRLAGLSGDIRATIGQAQLDGSVLRWRGDLAPGDSVVVTFVLGFRTAGALADATFVAESAGARGGPVETEPVTITHEVLPGPTIEEPEKPEKPEKPAQPEQPAAPVDRPDQLPRTGADSTGAALVGMTLLLGGAVVLTIRRLRGVAGLSRRGR